MLIEFHEPNLIRIDGSIKSVENYTELKRSILEFIATDEKDLTIEIMDSISIHSSLIGFFTKIIHRDGIKLSLLIHDDKLFSLLADLNLIKFFNVHKPGE